MCVREGIMKMGGSSLTVASASSRSTGPSVKGIRKPAIKRYRPAGS